MDVARLKLTKDIKQRTECRILSFFMALNFNVKDTLNKLGYKAKINTHTTSCIN